MNPLSALGDAAALARGWPPGPAGRTALLRDRDRRVARLVAHAYARVPYYRRLMDRAGLTPCDLRAAADLLRLPVTAKADLAGLGPAEITDPRRRWRMGWRFTTGSTGEPLRIARTPEERLVSLALQRRRLSAYRAPFRARTVAVSAHGAVPPHGAARLLATLSDWTQGRRVNLDCRLDPERLVSRLREIRPHIVLGYAGTLACVGDQLMRQGPLPHPPRMVLSGSETLTPLRRRQIREGFGAPVYDYYGAVEAGLIAWECPETGLYHLAEDHVVLHLEQDGRPVPAEDGARGEVVVTNLHAYAMPFLRYRLADAAVLGPCPCPCGAPFAALRTIEGRWMDHFVLPDGRRVHPFDLAAHFVETVDFIRQYQLVQEAADRFRVRVAVTAAPPGDWADTTAEAIRRGLAEDVRVEVDVVDRIALAPSGKYRLAESWLAPSPGPEPPAARG